MHCYCSGYSGIREQSNDPILLVVEFGSGFAHIPPVRGRVIELSQGWYVARNKPMQVSSGNI
jgi:hypothetical protein